MARLQDPVTILKGVGFTRAKQLEGLGIRTLQDLICHFPRGYEDRTRLVTIGELEEGVPACFRAMVAGSPRAAHIRKGLDLTRVQVADHTARLTLTFFNRKFSAGQLEYGKEYIFYGQLSGDYSGYGMTNPVFEAPDSPPVMTRRVLPVYPLTAGLSNTALCKAVSQALALCDPPEEILPPQVRAEYGILPAAEAYRMIHSPASMEEAAQARKRMIFEEFFLFSAGLALLRYTREEKPGAVLTDLDLTPFYQALPFALTNAQNRAIGEIVGDFTKGRVMNRLVQGDVGSGKTMVAAAAAYLAVKNGFQAAMMAPTEILAEQHAASLGKLFAPLGIRVELLTGSLPQGQRRLVQDAMASGEAQIVVGTHALVAGSGSFSNLGLVITDEQHRFGVSQRAKLSQLGNSPHVLVMSATPIPRTLALLMYGDLDVSIVDELPPGRQPVDTFLVNESYRSRMNAFVRKQAQEGHQCFVVCPAVEENQELNLKAAETWAETLQKRVFPDLKVLLLHGQMKSTEKDAVMSAFARGDGDVLVATTVIEVGVDVPNATLMIIEDADRFGLSQLHQLRGRVGRGSAKSYCILTTQNRNVQTLERLKAFCKTNDGFQIAQEDLKLRGPGDFFGSRQSGLPAFRMGNLGTDLTTLQQAQQAAVAWIDTQGTGNTPEAEALRRRIGVLFREGGPAMN